MATSNTVQRACCYCSKLFAKRGVKNHERTCHELLRCQQQDADFEAQLLNILDSGTDDEVEDGIFLYIADEYPLDMLSHSDDEVSVPDSSNGSEEESCRLIDDIETIYHPSSGLSSRIETLEEYNLRVTEGNTGGVIASAIDPQPWQPFRSLLEFELCEFILDASLTNGLMATLLDILDRSSMEKNPTSDQSLAHLHHPRDINKLWDQASFHRTPFNKSTFTVNLKGTPHHYDVYHLSLWQWALDLIQDPILALHFVWDAVRLSKWNDRNRALYQLVENLWLTFYMPIRPDSHLLALLKDILWLYSVPIFQWIFEMEMVLVVAGLLDGYQYGLSFIFYIEVLELSQHKGKQYFTDFKREVWHAALNHILQPVYQASRLGEWVQVPGRSEPIHVFPVLLMLSADYEEHQGKKPCTTCLVPDTEQNKLDVEYEHHSRNQGEQNKLLSELGLHGIEHLRPEVISHIDNFNRKFHELADEQDLYHFQGGFMTITFTDGAKSEDLSKQILFVVHNIITKQQDSHGYLLLKCIRSYLELDMYSNLHVHTTETLQAIEAQRDIMEKGATHNYNMKPNEKMHGSLKDTYQLRTNFKGVAEQILCVDQWYNATSFIWQQINLHDEQLQFSEDSKIGNDKEDGNEDEVFEDHPEEIPMRNNKKVVFNGFQPYDKLILLFECMIEDKAFPTALVHPFSEPVSHGGGQRTLDADLGFYWVRVMKRHSSTFISTYSIVRGALLVKDFGYKTNNGPNAMKEYLVVDVIDADMFLHMKILSYIGQCSTCQQRQ
ncbi:hypothetical protein F5146DRAFT_1006521 [Armillaria mellea]|nr:hypothetical protein F5146DRAFT_1006521 [Armillaria mellea]